MRRLLPDQSTSPPTVGILGDVIQPWRPVLIIVLCAASGAACGNAASPARSTDAQAPNIDASSNGKDCAGSFAAVPIPTEASTDSFVSIAGTGPDDVWVCSAADSGTVSARAVHLLHWNGSSLAASPIPSDGCDSLWAAAPGELWAGGAAHYVGHFTGGAWSDVSLGDQRPADAIWGTSSSNVWFVGDGDYWGHWDGGALTPRPAGGIDGTSIWGTAPRDLWTAAGGGGSFGYVEHVGGSVQSFMTTTTTLGWPVSPQAVWAADDQHVWVVGAAGFIAFFDGKAWSTPASGTSADLSAVWGASADDVWAVGAAGTMIHWNGTVWSPVAAPSNEDLVAVWGTGCSVWVVGASGTIFARR